MVNLKVKLCGTEIDNPVIPASGTFGYGYEFMQWYDINILGTFSCKGTTKDERFGNPLPRIAEAPGGMLNAVGLQNPGVEKVISEELPRLKDVYKEDIVGWLEVNISCPNVHGGGMSFGTDPSMAAEVTKAVKAVTKKPVIMKLSPNVTDIKAIASACENAGADGISLINTLMGMRINLKTKRPLLANTTGGYSGPGIFPVALRMVYDVYDAVDIPVIGMGGVSTADDVIEMMMAGASAVEVGAANLIDPCACSNIIDELPAAMEKYGISDLSEIIGIAHKQG